MPSATERLAQLRGEKSPVSATERLAQLRGGTSISPTTDEYLMGLSQPTVSTRVDSPAPTKTPVSVMAKPPMAFESREKSLGEAVETIGGGILSGMYPGELKAEQFGARPERLKAIYGSDPGYKVGEFIGMAAPLGAAFKAGKWVKGLTKEALGYMPWLMGLFGRGAVAGALFGTYKQGTEIGTKDFDLSEVGEQAAAFGLLEGGLTGVGGVVRKVKRALDKRGRRLRKQINPATENLYKSEEPAAALIVNETRGISKPPYVDYIPKPGIRKDELAVMEGIQRVTPQRENPAGLWETGKGIYGGTKDKFRTMLGMHERYGTKELMLEPVWKATDDAVRATQGIRSQFKRILKENISIGQRGKSGKNIGLYAISRQKGGMETLAQMGYKDIPTLNPGEMKAYLWMRGQLEQMYGQLSAARRQAGLEPFGKVENYFTFFRNLEGELAKGQSLADLNFAKLARFGPSAESTPFRYAKKRILDEYGPLNLDAFNIFETYAQTAQQHIYLTPTVGKIHQLLDGSFHDGFKLAESNPVAYNDLKKWIDFTAGKDVVMRSPRLDRALKRLNRNLLFAVLSYNIRTILIQPSAIVGAMSEIGPKYTMMGIDGMLGKGRGAEGVTAVRKFVMDNSHVLKGREYDATVSAALEGVTGRLASVHRGAGLLGLKPLKLFDMETAKAAWYGAYRRGREQIGLPHYQAARYADGVVIKTQASGARSDIADIQRSSAGKVLTAFQTFVINNWNYLARDVAGLGNPRITNKRAFQKVMTYMAGAQMFNVLYEDGLGMRSPFPAPVREFAKRLEKDDDVVSGLHGVLQEFAEEIPVIGGGVRYGGSMLGAGSQLMTDIGKVAAGGASTVKTLETAGKVVGVPGTTQAKKTYRWMQEQE